MSFQVAAIQAGPAIAAGTYLDVLVLTGATGTGATVSASGVLQAAITPQATGSLVYGSLQAVAGAVTANGATTILDSGHESTADGLAHVPLRTTAITTAATPVTVGASAGGTPLLLALAEVMGNPVQDASSPGPAFTTGGSAPFLATSAAFTPPSGSLLVAIVSANGAVGVNSVAIADSSGLGLTWTEVVRSPSGTAGYAGVWVAQYPAPGSPAPVGQVAANWQLQFADEFSVAYPGPHGTRANPQVWQDHLNNGDATRTNNTDELEWYPHGYYGQSVSGSILSLTARFENPQSVDAACPNPLQPGGLTGTFTSGMISSQPGFAATYGYWEARVQDTGTVAGTWPAFWMITRDVAYPPEIDIDEYNVPGHSDVVHNGYRTTAGVWTDNYLSTDTAWHVYGLLLDASHVTFYRDGVQTAQMAYDGDAYAWITYFNHAVSSAATDGTGYPLAYQVDYLRYWAVAGAPAQPVITSISPASGIPTAGSITVTFAAVSGATSYRVTPAPTDYLADGTARPSHSSASGASSPITITGLTNGARYNVTVCAINASGYSAESLPVPSLGPPASGLMASSSVVPLLAGSM